MAGSIVNNAAAYKKYNYVAPKPPSELIDSTMFVIDFPGRKFLNVGLDPINDFNVAVHIITPYRHVSISHDFLKRIYSFMGNILSMILDTPDDNKNLLLFSDDVSKLSKTIYRGENTLVIESKVEDGCRVLLNRADLITLQYMEWAVFEACIGKTTVVRPMVLHQFKQITDYFKLNCSRKMNIDEMAVTIRNVNDELISSHVEQKTRRNFISELKLLATRQLAEQCVIKKEPEVNLFYSNKCRHIYYIYYYYLGRCRFGLFFII